MKNRNYFEALEDLPDNTNNSAFLGFADGWDGLPLQNVGVSEGASASQRIYEVFYLDGKRARESLDIGRN